MAHIFCVFPSARPANEVIPLIHKWEERGYTVGLWRDPGTGAALENWEWIDAPYQGYPTAMNALIRKAFESDADCQWTVCAADDTYPDPNKTAQEIAADYTARFGSMAVVQPTGDPWSDHMGRVIERIAGSPWISRGFAERAYGGNGPWWPEYRHCFVDNELQEVAKKLGCFHQDPTTTHFHDHWGRPKDGQRYVVNAKTPDFLREANSQDHWRKYRQLFESRLRAGFPGSELREIR